jgi:hypothetical protein
MTKYEYSKLLYPVETWQLSLQGGEGWRLVHIYQNGDALFEREIPTTNAAFGKKLVLDARDGTYWFGEIRSPNNYEEESFGFGRTDIIQVGLGDMEVQIPAAHARVFGNVKTLEEASNAAVALGFQYHDCDHDYSVEPDYPYILPAL